MINTNKSIKLSKIQEDELKSVYVFTRTTEEFNKFAQYMDQNEWKLSNGNPYASRKSPSCMYMITFHNIFYGTFTSDLSNIRNVMKILTLDEFFEYMHHITDKATAVEQKSCVVYDDKDMVFIKIFQGTKGLYALQDEINRFIHENKISIIDLKIDFRNHNASLLYTNK